jgi:voltage-gated potassium channel
MDFATALLRFAYRLQGSTWRRRAKAVCYQWLESPRAWQRRYFDLFMLALVISSVFLLLYALGRELSGSAAYFADVFEVTVVAIFVVEYLLRMWLYSDSHRILIEHYEQAELLGLRFRVAPALWAVLRRKLEYMATPLAIIDLLSILPGFRMFRVLRILLLVRLLKVLRYTRNISAFGSLLAEKRFELYTLLMFLGFVVFVASVAVFMFEQEAGGSHIDSLFNAVYWAIITVTTVGYGDLTPVSPEGRIVAMALVFAGLGVLSFGTSIMVSAFSEKLRDLRENRIFSEIERLDNVTLLCGFGRIGHVVATRLAAAGEPFVVVDKSTESIERARRLGFRAILGDATDTQLLRNLGLGSHVTRVLCLTHDDVSNVYITLTARHLSKDIVVIARANRQETTRKLTLAGANHVMRPYEVVARMAAEYIGQPVAFDALYSVATGDGALRLHTVVVLPASALDGRSVAEMDVESRKVILFGVLRGEYASAAEGDEVFAVANKHFIFNPRNPFRLRAHDVLFLIGYEQSVAQFRREIATSRIMRGGRAA